MTANQIMIPIIAILFAAFVLWMVRHLRRQTKVPLKQAHQPHSPDQGLDPKAIHKSLTSGFGGQNTN